LLASKIRSIFENDLRAIELGVNAMKVARKRHDPDKIVRDQIEAYKNIILDENE